jgi:putative aldouronate transport system substrate-binding protein
MIRFKKGLSAALTLMLTVSVLAACSDNSNSPAPQETKASETQSPGNEGAPNQTDEQGVETAPFKDGKYDPAIPMNIVVPIGDDTMYFNGETAEKNILFDQFKENLGLDINVLWTAPTKNEGFKTKLLLSLSSGEKLPDVINTMGDVELTNLLIESGKFMDLTDHIDKYASEGVKRVYDENPELFHSVTRDGKIMALPIPAWGPNGAPNMYVRQDWLDKLQLKAPTTIKELEAVMEAFVNNDPDGNNVKDTVGLAVQLKNPTSEVIADATALYGAFGVLPSNWAKSEDGQSLIYDPIQPEMKTALSTFRSWMEKGYISKDAPQQDGGTAAQLFTSGKAGIIFGPNWLPYWPLPDLAVNVPGAEFKVYPIPVGENGKAERRVFSLVGASVLVNKDYKHPDAVFKYADVMFTLANVGGIWDLDTKSLMDKGYMEEGAGSNYHVVKYGFMPNYFVDPWYQIDGYLDLMLAGKPGRSPGEHEGFDNCLSNPQCIDGQIESMKVWKAQQDADVMSLYSGPVTPTQKTQGDFLSKMEYETQMKIIFGTAPVEEFDVFVEKWKSGGGDKITEEVNEWYRANILKQ